MTTQVTITNSSPVDDGLHHVEVVSSYGELVTLKPGESHTTDVWKFGRSVTIRETYEERTVSDLKSSSVSDRIAVALVKGEAWCQTPTPLDGINVAAVNTAEVNTASAWPPPSAGAPWLLQQSAAQHAGCCAPGEGLTEKPVSNIANMTGVPNRFDSIPYVRDVYIEYMLLKVHEHDWHGASDAANDLREIDAKYGPGNPRV
jgi:hypothetical protein